MTTTSFNLLNEPWIRVRLLDGTIAEWSLRDVLGRASEVRSLAGELPSQDAALLRLLLAVLLRVGKPGKRDDPDQIWKQWWDAGAFPEGRLDGYLSAHEGRFDLLDAQAPFFQVAGLTTESGKRSGLGKLIADLPDGHPFFTTRAGREAESLSLAEAARWLVHCQAFDTSGIKSGAVGDPRVKGGKGYPFGYPAWCGNLGLVILEGANLFETLMLNLPLGKSKPNDQPVWERDPLTPAIEQVPGALMDDEGLRKPIGPADLFTWPSRRVRLFIEGDRVVDVQISNGDKRAPQNLRDVEPLSAWRFSANQSKKGSVVFMPVMHAPSRHVWQGLGALLQNSDEPKQEHNRASVLEMLSQRILNGAIDATYLVDMHVVGLEYGAQNSTITGAVDDRLTASVAALTQPTLVQCAVEAATKAREGVTALANLASDLDKAAGGEGEAPRSATFERGYGLLDGPYRAWVRTLVLEESTQTYRLAWSEAARRVLVRAADSLVANAGHAAIVGRPVKQIGSDDKRLLDAGVALNRFHHKLLQTFPRPSNQDR